MFQHNLCFTLSIRFAGDIMDAVFAVFKKTAIVLSLALLAAKPRLAQDAAPTFTSPGGGAVYTVTNEGGSVIVTGSQDSGNPPQLITFAVSDRKSTRLNSS